MYLLVKTNEMLYKAFLKQLYRFRNTSGNSIMAIQIMCVDGLHSIYWPLTKYHKHKITINWIVVNFNMNDLLMLVIIKCSAAWAETCRNKNMKNSHRGLRELWSGGKCVKLCVVLYTEAGTTNPTRNQRKNKAGLKHRTHVYFGWEASASVKDLSTSALTFHIHGTDHPLNPRSSLLTCRRVYRKLKVEEGQHWQEFCLFCHGSPK